jgi:anti-sigma factor RsiW
MAAMLALTLAGGGAGWWLHGAAQTAASGTQRRASAAGACGAGPCGVHAGSAASGRGWRRPASASGGMAVQTPGCAAETAATDAQGYTLEGGRLLPGQSGPVAQFMYRDGGGVRLTLYVSTEQKQHRDTGFRFAQEGEVSVFYWLDGQFGYALSGNLDKAALATLANAVYAQLEPSGE